MRKSLIICFIIILGLFLSSCNNSTKNVAPPKHLTESEYKGSLKAIKIIDDYLDFEISKSEAKEELEEIENRINYDGVENEKRKTALLYIYIDLNSVTLELSYPSPDDNEILDSRNSIAETIELDKRK